MKSMVTLMKTLCMAAMLTGMTALVAVAADAPKATLVNNDCVKCHVNPPADIAANGGAHKTSVSCQDCHAGHRPLVKNNVPLCSQCHSGKPHYKLANCSRCHNNPHTPKIIKLANNITEECLSCHNPQIVQLKQHPSKHTKLACSFCHNIHGKIPLCTQCHKPHGTEMGAADCKRCHKAHMPTVVTYASDTANNMCAPCHKKAGELLHKTNTKHKAVACVTCHKDKHKMVPTCQSCHGVPHPAPMMTRFTTCGECHSTAHDLNRWDAGGLKATPAAAPAKKGVKKK